MSTSKDMHNDHVSSSENYKIKDADDNNGIVPDDALQRSTQQRPNEPLPTMIRIMW